MRVIVKRKTQKNEVEYTMRLNRKWYQGDEAEFDLSQKVIEEIKADPSFEILPVKPKKKEDKKDD